MPEIVIAEAPGVRIAERIRHQGFFFGHHDADLEQRWLPDAGPPDPAALAWPEDALVLRVLHHIARVRYVWDEPLVAAEETATSARVHAVPGAILLRDQAALDDRGAQLRDHRAAERALRGAGSGGIIVAPGGGLWAKLRPGERLAGA